MTLLDDTRVDLDNDLFAELGTSITHYSFASTTVDKWGDGTESFTSTSVTAVPYNQGNVKEWEKYGTRQSEVLEIAIKYVTAPTVDDRFLYDGVYYGVGEVNKYPLLGGNLVSTVVLYKHTDQTDPTI